MDWMRKSKCRLLRRIIAEIDYEQDKDVSWAETDEDVEVRKWAAYYAIYNCSRDEKTWPKIDPDYTIRYIAAQTDFESLLDLTWAKTDADGFVRQWAARQDFSNNKDTTWARTDPDPIVRKWAARQDCEKKRDMSWAKKDPSFEVKYWYNIYASVV